LPHPSALQKRAASMPKYSPQGSLPEICQKLRHAQPHVPTPRRLQQHRSPRGLRGDVRLGGVLRTTGASMVSKRSGVQIPSAPPQLSGPIRPRPPRNLPPRAADRQQSALPRAIRHQLASRSPGHVGPPPVPVPRRATGSARQFDGEPAASSLSGFSTRACFGRIATATCATMHRWRPLRAARSDGLWTKRGPSRAPADVHAAIAALRG
jgi:hypothetical protein